MLRSDTKPGDEYTSNILNIPAFESYLNEAANFKFGVERWARTIYVLLA